MIIKDDIHKNLEERHQVYDTEQLYLRDRRLLDPCLDTHSSREFPFCPTKGVWEKRARELRRHILISCGLWPMLQKTPLNAKLFDTITYQDFSIAKVFFESYPGYYVTGNLYRPIGKKGPFPGILCPHGHWDGGRLAHNDIVSVPGCCVNFARQGYIVLSYDMVGYQDNRQLSHEFADTLTHQLWSISVMGLQLWNSIRALDFLISLPDIKADKIGCTGASGGGTQTFMLAAIDKRVTVSAPVNMISAHFQGGCVCENAPGLRLAAGNPEFAALAAPRPLLVVSSTQDWSKNTPMVEFPMIRSVYQLYDAEDRIACVQFDYPHNYNRQSRKAVYAWFGKWLLDNQDDTNYQDRKFLMPAIEQLQNFPEGTFPPGNMDEVKLTDYLELNARSAFELYWPKNPSMMRRFRNKINPAYRDILAATSTERTVAKIVRKYDLPHGTLQQMILTLPGRSDWIPCLLFQPSGAVKGHILLVHSQGKRALLEKEGLQLSRPVKNCMQAGYAIMAIDVFKVGEHILPESVKPRAEQMEYFTTYNRTDAQERIQDVLTAAAYLHQFTRVKKTSLILFGMEQGGIWVLLAAGLMKNINRIIADMQNGEPDVEFLLEKAFIPGIARYGGILSACALAAPAHIMLYNCRENTTIEKIKRLYRSFGSCAGFFVFPGDLPEKAIKSILNNRTKTK